MKKFLITVFFLSSCALNQENKQMNFQDLNFEDNLTLNEFKLRLEEYAENNSFPNIDN